MKNILLVILPLIFSAQAHAVLRNLHADTITNNTSQTNPSLKIPAALATASTAAVFDATSTLASSPTTAAQLGFLDTVTSNVQTQLNAKQSTLTFSDSIVNTGGVVTLVHDVATPTASTYYGTNASSVLGYYSFPASAVTSVTNSDGTLTISPTTGNVVASLALGHSNTWTATQNFAGLTATSVTDSGLTPSTAVFAGTGGLLSSSSTTSAELAFVHGVTSNIQTQLNGKQSTLTFADSIVNTAGTVTLVNDTASPTASTYYGTNASSVLGYHALPASGSGTVTSVSGVNANGFAFSIATPTTTPAITLSTPLNTPVVAANGTAFIAGTTTGTGSTVVLAASPSLTSPALDTPTAITLTNATGLPLTTGVTGILPVANGGTGDASFSANQVIIAGSTTTAPLAVVTGGTVGQVLTAVSATAAPTWQNPAAGATFAPTIQKFTSGSGTYTTPTSPRSPLYIKVTMVGGGGGGGPGTSSTAAGGNGGTTTFGTSLLTATGGIGGAISGNGGAGGTVTIGAGATGIAIIGGQGGGQGYDGAAGVYIPAGMGGMAPFFAGGAPIPASNAPGVAGVTNTGGGGSGGSSNATNTASSGSGGGSGGFIEAIVAPLLATYSYSVGTSGSAGTGGSAGGAGASGIILVEEFYQ